MSSPIKTALADKYFFQNDTLEFYLHSILKEKIPVYDEAGRLVDEVNVLEEIMNVFRYFLLLQRIELKNCLANLNIDVADTEFLDILGENAGSIRPLYNPQQDTPFVHADDDRNVIDFFKWYTSGAEIPPAPEGDITMPNHIYRQLLKSFLLRRVITVYSVNEMEYLAKLTFDDWKGVQLLLRDGQDNFFDFDSTYELKTFYFKKSEGSPDIDVFDYDLYVSQDMPIDYQNFLLSRHYNERHEIYMHNYPYPANIRVRRIIEVVD